jgi:integrase/recombinase XerD
MAPMNDSQLEVLRKTANETGRREACLIALMTRHIIRCSEVAGQDREGNPTGLKVSDVNLKDGTITINRLKGSVSKTEALRPGEREALEAWLAVKPKSPWLFPGRNESQPMDRKTVYNIFHSLCVKAGIPDTSAAPHASRHTLGTSLTQKGAPMKLVQQAGGWKTIQAAAKYQELTQAHVDAEVTRLLGLTEAA